MNECDRIQENLKLQNVAKVIVSQALYPGREGAETSCRKENQETVTQINLSSNNCSIAVAT